MDLNALSQIFYFLVLFKFVYPLYPQTPRPEGCLDPGPIENGNREPPAIDGYLAQNTVIRFSCYENYIRKGAMKVYCGNDNHWFPKNLPECILIYCQDPNIANGMITGMTVSGFPDHYVVNSAAPMSCNTGFKPSTTGEIVNRCGPDGSWLYSWAECQDVDECSTNICQHGGLCVNLDGSYQCHCDVHYIGDNCEKHMIPGCSEPKNVTNADREFTRKPPQENGYYYLGSSVVYHCKSGYTMSGNSALYCTDGQWEGEYPECDIRCKQPATVSHSSYKPKSDTYSTGDQVVYTCEEGFYIVGIDQVTCSLGNWTGTGQTTCLPKYYCQDPGAPENGDRCCQEVFIPGVEINFYCNNHYNLVGNAEIKCQPDGSWDNDIPPLCVPASPEVPDNGDKMLTNETFTIVVAISGSIMGILTVTVILSIRECCTQRRRRRPRCRYHASSIASRVARIRERHHSHLMSLTSNMEVPLPSYEEATAGNATTTSGDAAENNDVPPELPPRPPHMIQVQLQTTQSEPRSNDTTDNPSPPIQRSSWIPPWRRRRRASQEQQNAVLLSSELCELPNSSNLQEDLDQSLINILDETSRNASADTVSLESGVISDQRDDGSEISAIAGELTPSGSSESLSTFEGIPMTQQA